MYQHVLELLVRLSKMLLHEPEKREETVQRAESRKTIILDFI